MEYFLLKFYFHIIISHKFSNMSTLFHVFMSFNILKGWEINIYKVLNEIIVKNQHNIMQNCIKYAICGVNDNFYNWNFKKKMIQSQKSKLISFWNFTQRKKNLGGNTSQFNKILLFHLINTQLYQTSQHSQYYIITFQYYSPVILTKCL